MEEDPLAISVKSFVAARAQEIIALSVQIGLWFVINCTASKVAVYIMVHSPWYHTTDNIVVELIECKHDN